LQERITLDDMVILPIPIDPRLGEALTLAEGIEEYGTLKQLINEIIDFALAKFDPVSNRELFILIQHIFLASWFVPKWMKSYSERFFPAITARVLVKQEKTDIDYSPLDHLQTNVCIENHEGSDPVSGN
jgi:hypothetical protein